MKKLLLFLLFPLIAAAQGSRYDSTVLQQGTIDTVTNAVIIPVNPIISFCVYPASGVPCTNKATTFTDKTLTVACPTSTQITLAGTNTCVGSPDTQDNWGVWVPPGTYSYTITGPGVLNNGPYVVTVPCNVGGACPGGTEFPVTTLPTSSTPQMITSPNANYSYYMLLGTAASVSVGGTPTNGNVLRLDLQQPAGGNVTASFPGNFFFPLNWVFNVSANAHNRMAWVYDNNGNWQPWQDFGSGGGSSYYQTIAVQSGTLPQEPKTVWSSPVTGTDTPGISTNLSIPVMVAAGPSHASGLVPDPGASASPVLPLCNNGTFSSACQGTGTTITNPTTASNLSNDAAPWEIQVDMAPQGPNPSVDVRNYHVRAVLPNSAPAASGITGNISSGSNTLIVSSASSFQNGDGIDIYGAGPATTMSTPSAPTVTSAAPSTLLNTGHVVAGRTGSTSWCYKIIARDVGQGLTAASTAACLSTGVASLGAQTATISTITQTNNTMTVTTSTSVNLVVGEMIQISGTSGMDATYGGFWNVKTVNSATQFTVLTATDSRSGANVTPATGGTLVYYNANHLVLPTPGTGVWQYYIYGNTSGAYNLLGVSMPTNTSLNGNATYMVWDDYGSPITTAPTLPGFVPSTAPSTATADTLVTTICNGAGTTSLTLGTYTGVNGTGGCGTATNASNTVTAAGVRFDNGPNIISAYAASALSGLVYFPATSVAQYGYEYVVNSLMNTSAYYNNCASIAGQIWLNDSWVASSGICLRADLSPASPLESSQFAITPQIPFDIAAANPGIVTGIVNLSGIGFRNQSQNSYNDLYVYGSIPTGTIKNTSFFGGGANDYSGIPIILFSGTGSDGIRFDDTFISTGPNQGVYAETPAFISKNFGEVAMDGQMLNRRSYYFEGVATTLDYNQKYEEQGGNQPVFTFYGGFNGSVVLRTTIEDTMAFPLVYNSYPSQSSLSITVDRTNGPSSGSPGGVIPLVTGGPIGSLTVTGYNGTLDGGNIASVNAQNLANGLLVDGIYTNSGTIQSVNQEHMHHEIGANYSFFTGIVQPAAPTCSNGTGTVPSGSYIINYMPEFQNGGLGIASQSTTCTSNGSQSIIITVPTAIPGAQAYVPFRNGFIIPCLPLAPTFSLSYTWSTGTGCGNSEPALSAGGPAGITNGNVYATSVVLGATVAPTGTTTQTQLYMDSTLNWPSFKPNGNTAYIIPGITGTISSGAPLCSSGTSGAITNVGCTGVGTGTQYAVTYWPTTNSLGSVLGSVTGTLLTAQNNAAPVFGTPGLIDGNGQAAVTTSGYTMLCDTTSTIKDRATTIRLQSGATGPIVPLSTATGCSGMAFILEDDGAGSITVSRTSPDTFSVFNGGTNTDGATSFALANGQYASVNQGASGIWEVRISPAGSGTVTHTAGSLTSGQLVVGNGSADIKVSDLTGDVTTSGSVATTLATVNTNTGSFTCSNVTVNGKGLITAAANGSCGGTPALSAVTALAANSTINNGNYYWQNNFAPTSNNTKFFNINESSAGSETGSYLFSVNTASGSTTNLASFFNNGVGPYINNTGGIESSSNGATNIGDGNYFGSITANNIIGNTYVNSPIFDSGSDSVSSAFIGGKDDSTAAVQISGSAVLRGGNAAGTGATRASSAACVGGGVTSNTGTNGLCWVVQPFQAGSTNTIWNLQCESANGTVSDCGANATNAIGVAATTSNPIQVVISGLVPINASAAVTLGHNVGTGSTGGKVTDCGGTASCTSNEQIGTVMATSGQPISPLTGAAIVQTISTSLPMVQFQPSTAATSGNSSVIISQLGYTTPSGTEYIYPSGQNATGSVGASADADMLIPRAGTLGNLYVAISGAESGSSTFTATLYHNDSSSALTCTVGNSVATCHDTTHTVSVSAGDLISIQVTQTTGTGTPGYYYFGVTLQ